MSTVVVINVEVSWYVLAGTAHTDFQWELAATQRYVIKVYLSCECAKQCNIVQMTSSFVLLVFLSVCKTTFTVCSVKPAVFDLFLGIAIAAYLAFVYLVVQVCLLVLVLH